MPKIDVAVATKAFEEALATHEQDFGQFFLARLLGFEFHYPADQCRVEFDVHDFMFNPQASLHGGISALAMDVSMGHLLHRLRGPGATMEMKIQYIRPVRSGRICATGRVLHVGREVAFLESRLTDSSGELAAFASATWRARAAQAATSTPGQSPG